MNREYRIADLESKLDKTGINRFDILVIGNTSVGKSTTINAILEKMSAQVGYGPDPETKDITVYRLNDKICFWDSPGLGDGVEQDQNYKTKIKKLLCKSYGKNAQLGYIDLVLVILEGTKKDIGTICDLLNDAVLPSFPSDRIIVAINQADLAMKGLHWDDEKKAPDEDLIKYLEELSASMKERINRDTSLEISNPVYFSAEYNYNVQHLLDFVIDNLPEERRRLKKEILEVKDNIVLRDVDLSLCKFGEWKQFNLTNMLYSTAATDSHFYFYTSSGKFYKTNNFNEFTLLDIDNYSGFKGKIIACNNKLFLFYEDCICVMDENGNINKLELPTRWSGATINYRKVLYNGKEWLIWGTYEPRRDKKWLLTADLLMHGSRLDNLEPYRMADFYFDAPIKDMACVEDNFYILLPDTDHYQYMDVLKSQDCVNWNYVFNVHQFYNPLLCPLNGLIAVFDEKGSDSKIELYDTKLNERRNEKIGKKYEPYHSFISFPAYNICLDYYKGHSEFAGIEITNDFKHWKQIELERKWGRPLTPNISLNYNYIACGTEYLEILHH